MLTSFYLSIVTIFVYTKRKNELEPPGTSWNYLERAETTLNKLELPGTTCKEMDSATDWHRKKKEIYWKKLYVQYHYPIEYNISKSYCNKKHHLRCLKVEPPSRKGAGNELTKIKTLMQEYCVYNIISLQNKTL